MSILLIRNHTGFFVQFETNLYLWVFQKAVPKRCVRIYDYESVLKEMSTVFLFYIT